MPSPAYAIRTERLLIRCYEPKDAFLLKPAIDQSLDHLLPWMPWAKNEPEDIEVKIERMRKFRGEFDLGKNFTMGIFSPDNSRLIGSTGLKLTVGEKTREIGYWLCADCTGKGFATEAAAALTKVAFQIDGVERVEIHCDAKNLKSAAVPARLGFKHEANLRMNERVDGERKLHMIWVLFSEDYLHCDIPKLPLEAYDVLGRRIL